MMNASKAKTFCEDRTLHWTTVINSIWGPVLGDMALIPVPAIKMLSNGSVNKFGHYRTKDAMCAYNIALCMLQGDAFDETVAHEVAHHVQFIVAKHMGWKTPFHGELWRTIMASTRFKPRPKAKAHGFPTAVVKAVAQLARIELKEGAA